MHISWDLAVQKLSIYILSEHFLNELKPFKTLEYQEKIKTEKALQD